MEVNRENLAKLASALERPLPNGVEFDMGTYGDHEHLFHSTVCGSVGCAIGVASLLIESKGEDEPWAHFSDRLFGLLPGFNEWVWLFDGEWVNRDSTQEGAALRIRHFLSHGLPENWRDQLYRNAPLCYREQQS